MTHINLMVDHTFGEPVAKKLNEWGSIKAATVVAYGFRPNEKDAVLIDSLDGYNCLLLTHDHNTINEHRYEPCSHGGIIIIPHDKWTVEYVFDRVKAFILSGKKSLAEHCVTYLHPKRAIIHTHDNGELVVLLKD